MVPDLPRGSCSVSYHPTSRQNRPRPLSFRFLNLPTHNQASLFANQTILFQDFWQYYVTGSSTDGQVGLQGEASSWLLPKDVVETDKPEDLAGGYLDLATCELSPWMWEMHPENFPIALLLAGRYPV